MTRLTAVSEELRVAFADRDVEAEVPVERRPARPAITPRAKAPFKRPGRAHYINAVDVITKFAKAHDIPAVPKAVRRAHELKSFIGPMIFGGLFGMLAAGEVLVFKYLPADSSTGAFFDLVAGLAAAVLLFRFSRLPGKIINSAVTAGNYGRALAVLEAAETFGLTYFTPDRSDVLLRCGKFAEAESWLRGVLLSKRRALRSLDLLRYARALEGLGETGAAEKLFYISADFLPDRPEPLLSQAELLLKRQHSPQGTLRLLEAGLQKTKKKSSEFLALFNAHKAQALNQLEDVEESDKLLALAFKNFEHAPKPLQARLNLIKASILLERGEKQEATALAKECVALDPCGPVAGDARIVLVASSLKLSEHRQSEAA